MNISELIFVNEPTKQINITFQTKTITLDIDTNDNITYVQIIHDNKKIFLMLIFKNTKCGTLETITCTNEYSGTFLLNLALYIGNQCNLKVLKLIDRSKIRNIKHGKHDETIEEKLIIVRSFQCKYTSWYEDFGFKFNKISLQYRLHSAMKNLHDICIPELFEGYLGDHMLKIRHDADIYRKMYDQIKPYCNHIYDIIIKCLRKDLIYHF